MVGQIRSKSQFEQIQKTYQELATTEAKLEVAIQKKNPNFSDARFQAAVAQGREPDAQGLSEQDKATLKNITKLRLESKKAWDEGLNWLNEQVDQNNGNFGGVTKDYIKEQQNKLYEMDQKIQHEVTTPLQKLLADKDDSPAKIVNKQIEKLRSEMSFSNRNPDDINGQGEDYQKLKELKSLSGYYAKVQKHVQGLTNLTSEQQKQLDEALKDPVSNSETINTILNKLNGGKETPVSAEKLQQAFDGKLPEGYKPTEASGPVSASQLIRSGGQDNWKDREIRLGYDAADPLAYVAIDKSKITETPIKQKDGSWIVKYTNGTVARYKPEKVRNEQNQLTHYATTVTQMKEVDGQFVPADNPNIITYTTKAGKEGRNAGVAKATVANPQIKPNEKPKTREQIKAEVQKEVDGWVKKGIAKPEEAESLKEEMEVARADAKALQVKTNENQAKKQNTELLKTASSQPAGTTAVDTKNYDGKTPENKGWNPFGWWNDSMKALGEASRESSQRSAAEQAKREGKAG